MPGCSCSRSSSSTASPALPPPWRRGRGPRRSSPRARWPTPPPASKTDKEVADDVYRRLALPLTRPMPLFAIKRDEQNDLLLDFYNINGIHRVTVMERERALRIDEVHNGLGTFFNDLHTVT